MLMHRHRSSEPFQKTFIGGLGNDLITSRSSADTQIFNRGDGQDVITDTNDPHALDSITIKNAYVNDLYAIESVQFAAGLQLSAADFWS